MAMGRNLTDRFLQTLKVRVRPWPSGREPPDRR